MTLQELRRHRANHAGLRDLLQEACEIFEIVYANDQPAGIESFLVRAHALLVAVAQPQQRTDPPRDLIQRMARNFASDWLRPDNPDAVINEQAPAPHPQPAKRPGKGKRS